MQVIYTANMFNRELPMSADTFERAVHELLRVLAPGGFVLSRGSASLLEQRLEQSCRTLLDNPFWSRFFSFQTMRKAEQQEKGDESLFVMPLKQPGTRPVNAARLSCQALPSLLVGKAVSPAHQTSRASSAAS